MGLISKPYAVATLLLLAIILPSLQLTEAQIGVCYGTKGVNLPCPQEVVNLYKLNGIRAMRLYEPNLTTLQALQGSGIKVMLGVVNNDIPSIACNQSFAKEWVHTYVVPFVPSIKYIAVGNEIKPSSDQASSVEPAMQNILNVLNQNKLGRQIKVSTSIDTGLIKNPSPYPSNAEFANLTYITPIINFLRTNDSPLLVNIQPYAAYIQNRKNIKLDFVLFTSPGPVFTDPNNGLQYQNLYDALCDSVYVALEKICGCHTNELNHDNQSQKPDVVNSESGHPHGGFHGKSHGHLVDFPTSGSDGGNVATVKNAKTYYTNLIKHVKQGTPLRPGVAIETYLFAMFDEDLKPGDETERNYGLFTNHGHPRYGQLNFS